MIIVEGADNSGKSTLASRLLNSLDGHIDSIVESEGPPKYRGELNDRIRRYFNLRGCVLFVRHPCVSQAIYELHRNGDDFVDPHLQAEFYGRHPFFIYCDAGNRGLSSHIIKEHDKPEHLEMLAQKHGAVVESYRHWAMQHAHIIYRIGDDVDQVIRMVKGVVQ